MPRTRGLKRKAIIAAAALAILAGVAAGVFALISHLHPFPVQALNPPPATVVTARDETMLRVFLPHDGRLRFPVSKDDVSPVLIRALVASEDRFFHSHPGVNPLSATF